jgi:hypothetical protein
MLPILVDNPRMSTTWRLILAAVIGVAVGVVGTVALWKPHNNASAAAASSARPRAETTLDPSGMADSVAFAARETYGAHVEPEAACPSNVPAERGYKFHCEASIGGTLVPVLVEVRSPLGFYSIIRVDGIPWQGPT